jgi:hypothetical protein
MVPVAIGIRLAASMDWDMLHGTGLSYSELRSFPARVLELLSGLTEAVSRLSQRGDDDAARHATALEGIHADLERRIEALSNEIQRQTETTGHLQRAVSQQTRAYPSWIWNPGEAARVRSILSLIQPQSVQGATKRRVGRDFDGGYVMLDSFDGIAAALSLGIFDDVSWDTQIADRGIDVLQFDPTVAAPPAPHERFRFEPLRIAPWDGAGCISIDTVLRTRLPPGECDLLLKIDIEGAEWDAFVAITSDALKRFRQIVCEFHTLERLGEKEFGDRAAHVFAKLAETHFPCHVHGNNCGSFANVANVIVPETLEVTFASRAHFASDGPSDELFPTSLDQPNAEGRADLFLGHFRFA